MEAKDLMIGDWIHKKIYLDGADKKPYEEDIQVKNIYGSEINCKIEDYTIVSGEYISDFLPIPLTPEILEKNGLINYETDVGIVRYSGNNICIRGWMANCELYIGMIKYVHELQHALHLCGLNDLADNFKV